MSYPDLGCFSECLQCELCQQLLDEDDDLDLDLRNDYLDDSHGTPPWADPDWGPEPPEHEGGLDELPTGIPLGQGWELRPTWDPYGLEFYGEF
ncbi:hypothetical protein [Paraliomyxa miuraensis]|uniref:hypothetical protein n=1 Tax=Paraliomyxa miuraensis TaxID=376150 RepID=UPI00224D6B03|nr:hypothetical protein [Paraliomyxa miuraensis]MCX4240481.1 hypothetical protein [Paraliomyxa miuraensis]